MINLGNDFGAEAFKGAALDEVLRFSGVPVALPLDDFPGEDDIFEVEDREAVVFEFIGGVGRDCIVERPDQVAKVGDGYCGHRQM